MTVLRLKGPLLFYTLILTLTALVHLTLRSWSSIDSNVRPFESRNVMLLLPDTTIPAEMSAFLSGFQQPAVVESPEDNQVKAKGDSKELGDLYVTLLAVYKSGSAHKAILEITEKESGKRQLKHLGLGDSFQEIQIEAVTGTSCSVRFRDAQLNFRLFAPQRAKDASIE